MRVLCSRGRYLEGSLDQPFREDRRGVDVRRVNASAFGRGRTAGRMSDYLSFHLLAGPRLLASRWADVVVTLTTPPLLGLWGSLAHRLRGPKHVVFLMDHHPDAEFELGVLDSRSAVGRAVESLYGWTLRNADHVGVLGPYMAERVARRRVPDAKVSVMPIWSRAEEVTPVSHAGNELRTELGWQDRFVVLYSGNAGLVHRFDELLRAMADLDARDPDVLFAFIGGGPRRGEIEDFARRRGLGNAAFLPYVPREDLRLSLSAADAHYLSLRPRHVGVSVPGKLYGQLASARPVLFVGPEHCESAEDLRAAGAGFVFEPGSHAPLAETILQLKEDPALAKRMGASGRAWFLANRERERCCERWRLLLEAIAAGRPVELPELERASDAAHVESDTEQARRAA